MMKRTGLWVLTFLGLWVGAVHAQTPTYLTDSNKYDVPAVSRPDLRVPITDPTFGTTVTRVTDPTMIPDDPVYPRKGLRHEYSRLVPVNADNTLMLVSAMGGAERGFYFVVRISDGQRLHRISRDGIDPTYMWHPNDPNVIFYRYGNEVRAFDVATGEATTLMSFPDYEVIATREEGIQSDDWRYYAFLGYKPGHGWVTADFVVADLLEQKIIGIMADQSPLPDWIGMSPSGEYVVAMFTDGRNTRLYDRNLNYIRTLFPDYTHSDFAIDGNGDEVMVYVASTSGQTLEFAKYGRGGIASVRLRDGDKKLLMDTKFSWSVHMSGIASRKHNGWALIETYSQPGDEQKPFGRELFWLNLDHPTSDAPFDAIARRIAHHHSDVGSDVSCGDKDYWAEPHATSSWDGNMVFFSSIWDEEPCTRYDSYIVTGEWWDGTRDLVPPPPPENLHIRRGHRSGVPWQSGN